MAALILSVAASVVIGALAWLIIGPRLKLNEDPVQNEVLNVLSYMGIAAVFVLPLVIFVISDLMSAN
ncbi:MAG: hypothetical protein F4W90_03985 [Gammaproteobacteria bacterium]|nr:hypothetical protein [Gammaproteobacteria bacterium]